MNIKKTIIKKLNVFKWNSFSYLEESGGIFYICCESDFPMMKYIIPLSQYSEFDGNGDKFDILKKISDLNGDQEIILDRIPRDGWSNINKENLESQNLSNICDLVIISCSDPEFTVLEQDNKLFIGLSPNLNLADEVINEGEMYYIALCFKI